MPLDISIRNLSSLIVDYRFGQVLPLDEAHVERWLRQFPNNMQVVADELVHIYSRLYFTRQMFHSFLREVLNSSSFIQGSVPDFFNRTSILNIQQHGHSQAELIGELNSVLFNDHPGVVPRVNVQSSRYVYMDDFLFSGNRLKSDIAAWISRNHIENCHVDFVYMGWGKFGQFSVCNYLRDTYRHRNITFEYWSRGEMRFENRVRYNSDSGVLWPTVEIRNEPSISQYIDQTCPRNVYRAAGGSNPMFSSPQARDILELEMTKASVAILAANPGASTALKPLGFSSFSGLGFGSMVASFRNCPNNSPLCLWWGDRHRAYNNAWYPLFERRTYDQ